MLHISWHPGGAGKQQRGQLEEQKTRREKKGEGQAASTYPGAGALINMHQRCAGEQLKGRSSAGTAGTKDVPASCNGGTHQLAQDVQASSAEPGRHLAPGWTVARGTLAAAGAAPAVAAKRFPHAPRLVHCRSAGAIVISDGRSLRVRGENGTFAQEASSCTPSKVQIRLEANHM